MPKEIKLKTKKNTRNVSEFIESIKDKERRNDAKKIIKIMKRVTGKAPVMWGESIVGFGSYTYYRSNGDEGTFLATGFSPRKHALTIYIMSGYKEYGPLLKKLGPHTIGASCLYVKHLKDVDLEVLETLIRKGLKDLKKMYSVH